jgi:deoxyribose-phosphate aldolase
MDIAKYIDHTLVRADATPDEIRNLCDEALEYGFASVCVNPSFVPLCTKRLLESDIKISSVVGFPLGATTTKIKGAEAAGAVNDGAHEIEMMLHIGLLKAKHYDFVKYDIQHVVEKADGALIKVIIETAFLTTLKIIDACHIAVQSGADFVKTSSTYASAGAKVEDVKLMREVVGPNFGVKASGGIKTYADAVAMIEAGANRLGCSAGVQIVKEAKGA